MLSCEYCEQSLFCLKTCNATKPKQAAKLNAVSDANTQLQRSPLDVSVRLRSSPRTFKQRETAMTCDLLLSAVAVEPESNGV